MMKSRSPRRAEVTSLLPSAGNWSRACTVHTERVCTRKDALSLPYFSLKVGVGRMLTIDPNTLIQRQDRRQRRTAPPPQAALRSRPPYWCGHPAEGRDATAHKWDRSTLHVLRTAWIVQLDTTQPLYVPLRVSTCTATNITHCAYVAWLNTSGGGERRYRMYPPIDTILGGSSNGFGESLSIYLCTYQLTKKIHSVN